MTRSRVILALCAAAIAAALVWKESSAQTQPAPPAAGPTRMAVCDVVKLFSNYQRVKDMEAKLSDRRRELKAEDDQRSAKLAGLEKELQDLNPAGKEYQDRLNELTRLSVDRESWIKFEEAREARERIRLTEDMYKDILTAVAQVAKERGAQVVLNSDESNPEQKPDPFRVIERRKVLYSEAELDITDAVLAHLNGSYKAGAK